MTLLLQSRFSTQFISEGSSTTVYIALGLIGLVFLILIIVGIISSKRSAQGAAGSQGNKPGAIKRRAKQLGLSKAHVKTLEYVVEKFRVRNINGLLTNSPQLDFYLRKAIAEIDSQSATEEVKEAQKLTMYRIKQIIERNSQKSIPIKSTKQLTNNQEISLTTETGQSYASRIVGVLKDSIAVEVPDDESGNQVRWKKWAEIKVFVWKSNGEGYSFVTKVSGYNAVKGIPSAFLQHSNKIQPARQRRFRRKDLDTPCYFYPVRIITMTAGRTQTKKALVDEKKGTLGTVMEVSSGGCSIRATRPLPKTSLVKVDFETEKRSSVSTYGKVVHVSKENGGGFIMHIMFTRLSKKNLNRINSYIYEYGKIS